MLIIKYAPIAQSVEQRTENPRVGGSIPPLGTILFNSIGDTFHSLKLLSCACTLELTLIVDCSPESLSPLTLR